MSKSKINWFVTIKTRVSFPHQTSGSEKVCFFFSRWATTENGFWIRVIQQIRFSTGSMGPKENGARENHGVKNQRCQMMSTLKKVISGVIASRFRSIGYWRNSPHFLPQNSLIFLCNWFDGPWHESNCSGMSDRSKMDSRFATLIVALRMIRIFRYLQKTSWDCFQTLSLCRFVRVLRLYFEHRNLVKGVRQRISENKRRFQVIFLVRVSWPTKLTFLPGGRLRPRPHLRHHEHHRHELPQQRWVNEVE